ncbi:hypothetical protein [Psychrobacter sp. S1-30-MNA-CIBAN-0213]|uniref:hypothetical protein n=1 Tax=unclassified Psychrobacter TaxID=196806 RepID=UPI00331E962C
MKSLSDYLNTEDTVKFIKEVTKVSFFNKGNLFDLVVKKELQPIIYFDGYGSTWRNKLYSPYPEDFEDMNEWSEGIEHLAQSNHVKGYFYILHGEAIINSKIPIAHRRFIIQNLVGYQIILDSSLPNRGSNSKGDIFRRTPLYVTDLIVLSNENPKDEIIDPYFSESDIKFYVLDLINMIEKNGYYSDDEAIKPNQHADDEPTHHKSVGSMQALVTTLIKMAEYDKADLTDPYGELNKLIQAKAETLGLSVKKDFIAKWLKKANEVL